MGHPCTPQTLTTRQVFTLVEENIPLELPEVTRSLIENGRDVLERMIEHPDSIYYGINTGFGDLHHVRISHQDLEKLQRNLILSHACGAGEEVPPMINRIIQFLKIRNLIFGYSGVRVETVERMVALYNVGAMPVIYQQGSLGASGDLAPLAHLALALIGEGEVDFRGRRIRAATLNAEMGILPLQLGAKEGLALLNGTQFSTAYGVWAVEHARKLLACADITAALSWDVFLCQDAPLNAGLHTLRNQHGQSLSASHLRYFLRDSGLATLPRQGVQDPYAFRCIPQVHGASIDAWRYVEGIINREINAVTDNPTIFPDEELIVSGGNFHAQPIALALDFLAIATAELANISERRIFQLVSGKRGLPPFLVQSPGLNSGMMIAQYTAASIVSQNKQLCTPASVDSIVSSNGQEDHVSMAANAATKLYRVIDNTLTVLSIEWMCVCQALDFRRPGRSAPVLEQLHQEYRQQVPSLTEDRILSSDFRTTRTFLQSQSEFFCSETEKTETL